MSDDDKRPPKKLDDRHPMVSAICDRNPEAVAAALKADPDVVRDECSVLNDVIACYHADTDPKQHEKIKRIMRMLLKAGASVKGHEDEYAWIGNVPAMYDAIEKAPPLAGIIAQERPEAMQIKSKKHPHWDPLFFAFKQMENERKTWPMAEACELLRPLVQAAGANVTNREGVSALEMLVRTLDKHNYDHNIGKQMMAMMVAEGADPNVNSSGTTEPLLVGFTRTEQNNPVKMLLWAGADRHALNATGNKDAQQLLNERHAHRVDMERADPLWDVWQDAVHSFSSASYDLSYHKEDTAPLLITTGGDGKIRPTAFALAIAQDHETMNPFLDGLMKNPDRGNDEQKLAYALEVKKLLPEKYQHNLDLAALERNCALRPGSMALVDYAQHGRTSDTVKKSS